MTDYSELVKALRGKFIAYDVTGNHNSAQLYKDAAAAIEELQAIAHSHCVAASAYWEELEELKAQLPKRGEWNNHEVACLLAEMFGDDCACNLNGIDEWLPQYCEFAETCCPNPVGVACWEQFLKHRAKMEVQDGD